MSAVLLSIGVGWLALGLIVGLAAFGLRRRLHQQELRQAAVVVIALGIAGGITLMVAAALRGGA